MERQSRAENMRIQTPALSVERARACGAELAHEAISGVSTLSGT
jgi:hypothetical protein